MATLQQSFQYQRLNRTPLDVHEVFANLAALQSYLSTGPAYAGQVVAVRNGTNTPDLYRINENYSYTAIGPAIDPTAAINNAINNHNRDASAHANLMPEVVPLVLFAMDANGQLYRRPDGLGEYICVSTPDGGVNIARIAVIE